MPDSADRTDARLDETALIARDLIRFDTSNYGDGKAEPERPAAEYVAAKLRDLGLEPELIDSDPGRTSVVARVAGEDRERGALVVHGHLDVVPAIADNWSVDPFGGVIKDGMLWGRGAVDMKNMDAMILASLGDILREGRRPSRDLVVAFFADEEAGGVRGSAHLVRTRPELFAGATEAISEVGGYSIELAGKRAYLVQTGEKALMWLTLRAHGTAGHGSQINTENAVTRLAQAIARIGSEEWPTRLTDTTRELLDEVARLLGHDPQRSTPEELALATGTASRFIAATLRTTANPSMLSAGYKANVIPDTAEATIDVRVLPGEEDAVLERLKVLAGEHVEILVQHRDIGLEVPFAGPLVESMAASLRRFDPEAEVLPYLLSGGTDNKALSTLGITGYGFAPLQLPPSLDFPALFHGVDERVPLDALVFGRKVLTDLLLRS
ncbi:M20/M25/M40 family metallo-hydrolase [Rathayibacter tanaceti]|uniref:M20/M25/M40 family metallo-hydrolase n=2 Tax=Rathayibacter tanaceti TaxID=1671680 RepID=A0A162GKP1_9MICO|nr:M20/M25/M40 family metallo-hydrolase [Rathayibacter tanaceti]KZX22799.1 Succinyl-diaminopimelate desuccinylase [Rathayibacter tanaceti]QHC55488.1 M20/M25/M40 family metallo-hydrolase [Rathayibacter tanaceti]TCO39739.1 acetylornithine deacetylase/succinyl-diaminopimelate desuccinylase-like protein [Rathayibacter tanaceti]